MGVCTPDGIQNLGGTDALKREIAALKQELSSLKTTVDTLKQTVNTQGTTINALKTTVGSTSISGIGGGTLTGAVKALNTTSNTALKYYYGSTKRPASGTTASVISSLVKQGYTNGTIGCANLTDLPVQNWGYIIRFSWATDNTFLVERHQLTSLTMEYNELNASTGKYTLGAWKKCTLT